MSVIALIPARYGSTRFPGKPLAADTGRPLIQHVVEQTRQAAAVSRVIVATDDARIEQAVRAFGGEVFMTGEHPNGACRIAEVVRNLPGGDDDIILNIQGDEPETPPALIDALIDALRRDPDVSGLPGAPMATLASSFADDEDPADPNIVKLVVSQHNRALYFSRSLIPFVRDPAEVEDRKSVVLKHPGLYAYRRWFLLKYVTLPATPLEQLEKLEQLRVLEHGYSIAVARVDVRHHGIDTPEQYAEFVRRWRAGNG